MSTPFPTNANYLAELRSILALHRLWVAGNGESAEADAIRDQPEGPRQSLSEAEKKRLRGLSEDLNSICDYQSGQPVEEMNPQARSQFDELNEARKRGEWDRGLEILRQWDQHFDPALLAYFRGSFWLAAGDPDTAAVFYEHATRIAQENGRDHSSLLNALNKMDLAKVVGEAAEVLRERRNRNANGAANVSAKRFFNNPHFLAYARLLRRLHQLIRIGEDETEEGEALRERMDEPARYLDQAEVDCLNFISADFYTLSAILLPVKPNPPLNLQEEWKASYDAFGKGDFPKALDLLRKNEEFMDAGGVAYFRGCIWSRAGEKEIALDFYRRAKDLSPEIGGYGFVWLATLYQVNPKEAVRVANDLLIEPFRHPPQLVLGAAHTILFKTTPHPSNEGLVAAKRLIPIFEDVVSRLENSGEPTKKPNALPGAIGMTGVCHVSAGDLATALNWFDKGLKLFPKDIALLIVRGIYSYGTAPERAKQDFLQAIQLGSQVPWPYFFLAHYHFAREQDGECLEMAQTAYRLAPTAAFRAHCLEWIAISEANMHYPAEEVRTVFQAAQKSSLENQRIEENFRRYERSATSSAKINWEKLTEKTIAEFGQRESRSFHQQNLLAPEGLDPILVGAA